jgi:hypothetical protein
MIAVSGESEKIGLKKTQDSPQRHRENLVIKKDLGKTREPAMLVFV